MTPLHGSPLLKRLTEQVGDADLALQLLVDRGHATPDGKLTPQGEARQSMGPAGRAIDRASRQSGHPPSAYRYNPVTNRATLR